VVLLAQTCDKDAIHAAILKRYRQVAGSAEGCFKYPTGREGAAFLGYDSAVLDRAPGYMLESFCGVGNPFSLGEIKAGESVLDVGCGAGFDLYIAASMVGESGSVTGIDMTPEMVAASRENIRRAELSNVVVREAASESLPFGPAAFDVVISNGVLNLSQHKQKSFKEIYRALRPGGRLQFADIVLDEDLPQGEASSLEAWSD
jgi:arsenite methyltransferase